jgi:hypothetical protein
MAAKKKIVQLSLGNTDSVKKYLKIDRLIKKLTERKEKLADEIKTTIVLIDGYDKAKKYEFDKLIRTSHRVDNELNQIQTFAAFKKPALRDVLFPTAVTFAAGKDKALAEKHGLLIRKYGNSPVIEVL